VVQLFQGRQRGPGVLLEHPVAAAHEVLGRIGGPQIDRRAHAGCADLL